jgi:hypothetical protein
MVDAQRPLVFGGGGTTWRTSSSRTRRVLARGGPAISRAFGPSLVPASTVSSCPNNNHVRWRRPASIRRQSGFAGGTVGPVGRLSDVVANAFGELWPGSRYPVRHDRSGPRPWSVLLPKTCGRGPAPQTTLTVLCRWHDRQAVSVPHSKWSGDGVRYCDRAQPAEGVQHDSSRGGRGSRCRHGPRR